MNKQYVARHSFAGGARQARNLITQAQASTPVAQSTIEYDGGERQVIRFRRAGESFVLGRAVVLTDQVFYLVASPKFAGHYYVVVCHGEQWQCSSREAEIARRCIEQVELYRRGRAKQAA